MIATIRAYSLLEEKVFFFCWFDDADGPNFLRCSHRLEPAPQRKVDLYLAVRAGYTPWIRGTGKPAPRSEFEGSPARGHRARSAYAVGPRPRPDAADIIACRTHLLFGQNRESADKRLQARLSDGHVKLDPDTVWMT